MVDIITYDDGFAARLSVDDSAETNAVKALYLEDYYATKQDLMDVGSFKKIDEYNNERVKWLKEIIDALKDDDLI